MKTVVVTGGSRGVGRETAIAFKKAGYNVAVNYYKSRNAALTLAEQGIHIFQADVSDARQVDDMFKAIGCVDILVNNAGIAQQKLFSDITEADWDNMFDVNVKGMFNCCKAALPGMINRKSGKIINISSIWGITGASCEVHYSASKAAVIGFTKALAKEVGPSGITVNCVAPGVICTEMNNFDDETMSFLKQETPLGVIGTCKDAANAVLYLASDHANFITGQVLSPNGGLVI